ncbi:MAG: DUF5721 family protein [Lachnospiraceae bacterium]|nr:DUF5721 family protein [Lachnospiraceae bacterium]
MVALKITSLKNLMNQLLAGNIFDIFLLEEAIVTTAVTYTIDGHINKEFYSGDEPCTDDLRYTLKPWSEIKGLCFDLIKGKRTPLNFRLVLQLKPEYAEGLIKKELPASDITQLKALILLIKYDGSAAFINTGTSYLSFIRDKEPERIWDRAICKYLNEKGISFEEA